MQQCEVSVVCAGSRVASLPGHATGSRVASPGAMRPARPLMRPPARPRQRVPDPCSGSSCTPPGCDAGPENTVCVYYSIFISCFICPVIRAIHLGMYALRDRARWQARVVSSLMIIGQLPVMSKVQCVVQWQVLMYSHEPGMPICKPVSITARRVCTPSAASKKSSSCSR